MSNKHALYALAYIQECDNPYKMFCNLIQYILYKAPNQTMAERELVDGVRKEFGINLPRGIVRIATNILVSQKNITKNHLYKLQNCSMDINLFEKQMEILKTQEQSLIISIKNFLITNYNLEWDEDRIVKAMSSLLSISDYQVSISLFEKANIDIKPTNYSDEYFVKRYLQHLIETKGNDYDNILQIIRGIIIIIGLSQSDEIEQKKKSNGTKFFIDTRLALRFLGYSIDVNVKAAQEVIQLIRKIHNGKICVFERTVFEIKSALQKASKESKDGCFSDYEMYQFSILKNYEAIDFSILAESIEKILNDNNIEIEKDVNWNENLIQEHTIDTEKLIKYIVNFNPNWNIKSIDNDVYNINQINILRKSNYTKRYGGENKLPILVTTNNVLVECVKLYAKDCEEKGVKCLYTSRMAPVITADGLACGLWTRYSLQEDLPLLKLSQIAYSAQQTENVLFERINQKAQQLDKKHYGHIFNLDERRREKLNDLVFKNLKGNDDISEEIIAESLDELIQIEVLDKNSRIKQLECALETQIDNNKTERDRAISIAASKYINNFGIPLKINIFLLKFWWIFLDIFTAIITVILNLVMPDIAKKSYFLSIIIPIILAVIPIIINYTKNGRIWYNCTIKFREKIKEKYKKRILRLINDDERVYQKEIVEKCMENFIV